MRLDTLRSPNGARHRTKIVGRGRASGHGKTSCRGHKGQKARTGGKVRAGFQGGQMPLFRRLPKRGMGRGHKSNMTRHVKVPYAVVNVGDLVQFGADAVVGPRELKEAGLLGRISVPVKVLGDGKINIPLTIHAQAFSCSAVEKIKSAGGTTRVIPAASRELEREPEQEA